MSWVWATVLLLVTAPFVLWPLIRHWQPGASARLAAEGAEAHQLELQELELDLVAGHLSEAEAARRRRELSGR